MAKVKKVIIEDEKELRKAVHSDNYIYVILLLVCVFINIEMFSVSPRWITFFDTIPKKVVFIAFQILFVILLFFWVRKKKKIITILLNGEKTKGKITDSVSIRSNSSSTTICVFTYTVHGKEYTVSSKDKYGSKGDTYKIIFETNNPENSIVYEHLKSNVQALISYE
ncbi:DUF3592 domain-containing protein [uncultured Dokdonia sp.]|uniref:DUF3592 domain-containing protein n=1 Tax=uncultured Dokdonia sp. TaxID=575653 RepID=UPI0026122B81|nr:DUF3592 domain-containing protein [uncultured Dokdonia sp.]